MGLQAALSQVLVGLEQAEGAIVLGGDAVEDWDSSDIEYLTQARLLKAVGRAQSVVCPGCEHRCLSDVQTSASGGGRVRAFVVCEMPDMQAQMGRVAIEPGRLRQWQATPQMLAGFLFRKLRFDGEAPSAEQSKSVPIGMLAGPNGRRWAKLQLSPLSLEINGHRVPLSELLFVDGSEINLDRTRVEEMLVRESPARDKAYTPNTDAREARKLETAAMRQDWRDEYAKLAEQRPGMTKRWYAMRIARMEIARGRDAETIRKELR